MSVTEAEYVAAFATKEAIRPRILPFEMIFETSSRADLRTSNRIDERGLDFEFAWRGEVQPFLVIRTL